MYGETRIGRDPENRSGPVERDSKVGPDTRTGAQDDGNGIYVWNAPGTVVEGNDVRWGRDGIFVNTSKRNIFRGNWFRDLRFAVHYMYANESTCMPTKVRSAETTSALR